MTFPDAALAEILTAAGIDPGRAGGVTLEGADPVLPTRYLVGAAGAAVQGAVGLAANDVWVARGGAPQRVSTDARRGALSLRTDRQLRLDSGPAPAYWAPISGFHRARDGWVQLHCQFPHFLNGVLEILGCENDRDAVAAAIAGRGAQEIEDRMAEALLPVFRMRSWTEWRDHPHGRAVDGLPLLEIVKIADSPPLPLPALPTEGARPLSRLRVLDLTRVIAGPVVGRTLAEHGAQVMRISGPHLPFIEALVMDTGHGKLAAHVDLRDDAGRATLRELAGDADVFAQSYRPTTLAKRGFSPQELARIKPGIVYVTLSAWGHAGPWAERRGFDTLVQCATGMAHEHGADKAAFAGAEAAPAHLPCQALDYIAGYLGAFGAMVALRRRASEGGSYLVRVSLAQAAHWLDRLGRTGDDQAPLGLPDPGPDDVADLSMTTETAWGRLEHLGPGVTLSETPPGWDRPPVPLGTDAPAWPS